MAKIIDISPEISPDLAVWPGDVPFSRSVSLDMNQGANLTLSSVTATLHLGAHTDAPNHYSANGEGIAERGLHYYYGEAQVIGVSCERGKRIELSDFDIDSVGSERVLFKTGSFPDPNKFNENFNAFSVEVIEGLASKGVILVGIDTPSVDLFSSKDLEAHNAILKNNMAILEGIILVDVEEGKYLLSALPLKLQGCDASPVRAILVSLPVSAHTGSESL